MPSSIVVYNTVKVKIAHLVKQMHKCTGTLQNKLLSTRETAVKSELLVDYNGSKCSVLDIM